MFLERRTVSRKTPGDGKLEITKPAAERLRPLGATFQVELGGRRAPGQLASMACTCRGADAPHEHYFVASELLRALRAASEVDLSMDRAKGTLVVSQIG